MTSNILGIFVICLQFFFIFGKFTKSYSHSDPPPILQQNMVDVTMNNNTISFPIFCQSIQQSHPVGIFNGGNPLAHSFSLIMFNLILNTLITRSLQVLLKPLKQPVIISQIIVSRFLHLVITWVDR